MMRTLGIALLALCAGATGALSARGVRESGKMLAQLRDALSGMAGQMQFQLLTLPELLAAAGEGADGPLGDYFAEAAALLRADPTCTAAQALSAAPWPDALVQDARRVVLALARCLGQTDLDGQTRALALAQRQVDSLCERHEAGAHARIRCRIALGAGAALTLTILLW